MAFILDDILIGMAASAAISGIGSALAPKPPGAPDIAGATQAGIQADLDTLPMRRQIEAAARLGTKVSVNDPSTTFRKGKAVNMGSQGKPNMVPYVASEWSKGGKYYGRPKPVVVDHNFPVQATKEYDFTGRGDIDTEVDFAKKTAASTLELQKKYGEDYIRENLRQQALADPEGTQARKTMAEIVQREASREAVSPVARELQSQVRASFDAGGSLDQSQLDAIKRTIEARASRGESVDGQAIVDEQNRNTEGRDIARQQQLLSLVSSGVTSSDVTYRKNQSDISNMASFRSGKTPMAQFSSLSGAQQGATPIARSAPLSNVNPNAGAAGAQSAQQQYGQAMNYVSQQANPWFAGIGTALKGSSALVQGGWKPLSN